jgi:hypothetical protein
MVIGLIHMGSAVLVKSKILAVTTVFKVKRISETMVLTLSPPKK